MTAPHTPPAAPALAAIEARAAAATRGPWRADHDFGYVDAPVLMRGAIVCSLDSDLCDDTDGADAEFIAHAREDIPALLAHVRRLTAALADSDARVASAVAAERARCAAVCRDIASDATDDDPVSETADACAEAIERASAPTGGAQ